MGFNIGDKVIIKSIKTKGEVTQLIVPRSDPKLNGSTQIGSNELYYIIDYYDDLGGQHSTGFKEDHIELDKQYYREKSINDILKGKVL